MADTTTIRVEVAYSARARECRLVALELPQGVTLAQAVRQSQLLMGLDDGTVDDLAVGVGGSRAQASQVLRDGDRIDICRPLRVDPKVARRERFQKQGVKSAGLFSNRRKGAKAGY